MARIHTFIVGYCTHPACMALRGAGLATRKFPARAYLLETRSGLYLLDTGYAAHFHAAAKGIYAPYRWITPVNYQHEQEHLLYQLGQLGIRPKDLRAILISHFHADHITGLADYPSVELRASAAALDSIHGLEGWRALRKAFIPALLPADFSARIRRFEERPPRALPERLAPFVLGWPIGESEELWVVPLPGHAEGQIGLFVQTEQDWTLLASDAAWAPEAYRELRGPSELSFLVQHSRSDYYATLAQLHALHRKGIEIQLTHE